MRTSFLSILFVVSVICGVTKSLALPVSSIYSIQAFYDVSPSTNPVHSQFNIFFGAADPFDLGETIQLDFLDTGGSVVATTGITQPFAQTVGFFGCCTASPSSIPEMGSVLITSLNGSFDLVGLSMHFQPDNGAFVSSFDLFTDVVQIVSDPAPVPLPAAFPLFAGGLGLLGLLGWRRKRIAT